jgi:hypothetical protein
VTNAGTKISTAFRQVTNASSNFATAFQQVTNTSSTFATAFQQVTNASGKIGTTCCHTVSGDPNFREVIYFALAGPSII